jgi:hypothetical protein
MCVGTIFNVEMLERRRCLKEASPKQKPRSFDWMFFVFMYLVGRRALPTLPGFKYIRNTDF